MRQRLIVIRVVGVIGVIRIRRKRKMMKKIPFKIQTKMIFISRAESVLDGFIKNNRVEIV